MPSSSPSRGKNFPLVASAPRCAPFYQPSFEFYGTLYSVTFEVSGEGIVDEGAEMRVIMAGQ